MENRLGIKNTPLCGLPRSGGVFGSAQGIMRMASTLPSVLCTKSLMFPWSIVRYPLITRRRVFYQTLETPYSRNEATMRECQRELSQILKSISPLTVEKKVCVKVPHLIDQSKYWKAFYFNLRFFLTNCAMPVFPSQNVAQTDKGNGMDLMIGFAVHWLDMLRCCYSFCRPN